MSFNNRKVIIYLGYNSFFKHKRGVENVILFQGKANNNGLKIYIHWDDNTSIKKYNQFICIGVKKNIFWPFSLNVIMLKLWIKYKYFLLHSHNPLMSIVSIFKTQIFTVHDALFYLTKSKNYKFTSFFFILEKILYYRIKQVHFISYYAKEMSLIPSKNNYHIIYNTSFLEASEHSYNNIKKKVCSTVSKILIVRSIELRAKIDLVLEVAKSLGDNYEFTIVGKGPLLNYFIKKVKSENIKNIFFLGYISDIELINYYKNTDIVMVPAEYGEGFGLPIIEGYLFNKPVIASNKCAIPEVIYTPNHLFENNAKSVINKIYEIEHSNKINYNEYYLKKFSNVIILEQLGKLYNSIYQ